MVLLFLLWGTDNFVPNSTLANKNLAINAILGAAFGAAGQRCMAISVGKLFHITYPCPGIVTKGFQPYSLALPSLGYRNLRNELKHSKLMVGSSKAQICEQFWASPLYSADSISVPQGTFDFSSGKRASCRTHFFGRRTGWPYYSGRSTR